MSAPSEAQVSRIDFQHVSTNPNSDPYPCRLYFTAAPPHGSVVAPLEPTAEGEDNGRPEPDVLFTHGAGSQLDNPTLDAFSEGLAATHTVLCFEDRRNVPRRAATFKSLLDDFPSVTIFGGRSKGSVASVEASFDSNVKKLILLSFPLSSQKSGHPRRALMQLQEDAEVLFIGGDRDELCGLGDLAEIRKSMKARSWLIQIEGGDHGIKFEKEKRRSVCELAGKIAGKWLSGDVSAFGRSEKMADLLVGWDESAKEFKCTVSEG